jgi:hypothetical protein
MSAGERVSYVHIICNCGHDQHEGRCGVDMGTTTGPCQCPVRWQPPKITVASYCVKCAESEATITRPTRALEDCCDRMERARGVLCPDGPTPACNWGMLDTTAPRAALAEGREKESSG